MLMYGQKKWIWALGMKILQILQIIWNCEEAEKIVSNIVSDIVYCIQYQQGTGRKRIQVGRGMLEMHNRAAAG